MPLLGAGTDLLHMKWFASGRFIYASAHEYRQCGLPEVGPLGWLLTLPSPSPIPFHFHSQLMYEGQGGKGIHCHCSLTTITQNGGSIECHSSVREASYHLLRVYRKPETTHTLQAHSFVNTLHTLHTSIETKTHNGVTRKYTISQSAFASPTAYLAHCEK